MTQKPIDLDLSEAFHRLKRTVMLFSAGLFLLHFAVPAETSELALPAFGAKIALATSLVKWLLWAGGFYYVIGFVLEARHSIRMNGPTMKMAQARNLEQHFEKLVVEILSPLSKLEKIGPDLPAAVEGALANLTIPPVTSLPSRDEIQSVVEKAMEGNLVTLSQVTDIVAANALRKRPYDKIGPNEPVSPEFLDALRAQFELAHKTVVQQAANAVMVTVTGHYSDTREKMKIVEAHLNTLRDYDVQLAGALKVVASTLTGLRQLSRDINGERRMSFYLWEITASVAAFSVATLVNLPWDKLLRLNAWILFP